jgi:hypothetical protein
MLSELRYTNETSSVNGIAEVINASEPNRLSVDFSKSRLFSFKGSYDVWSTDFKVLTKTLILKYPTDVFVANNG